MKLFSLKHNLLMSWEVILSIIKSKVIFKIRDFFLLFLSEKSVKTENTDKGAHLYADIVSMVADVTMLTEVA